MGDWYSGMTAKDFSPATLDRQFTLLRAPSHRKSVLGIPEPLIAPTMPSQATFHRRCYDPSVGMKPQYRTVTDVTGISL